MLTGRSRIPRAFLGQCRLNFDSGPAEAADRSGEVDYGWRVGPRRSARPRIAPVGRNAGKEVDQRALIVVRIAHLLRLQPQFHQPARPSCTAPRRIRENREAERTRLRALRMISLQRRVAIFRLLLGSARANALRKRRNRPESTAAHPGNCKNSLEGRLVLGRDPLVPFEPAATATLISTASVCLRTSIFGRL